MNTEVIKTEVIAEKETVTISKAYFDYLEDKFYLLLCLEGAGVDNWSGYSDAWDMYKEN